MDDKLSPCPCCGFPSPDKKSPHGKEIYCYGCGLTALDANSWNHRYSGPQAIGLAMVSRNEDMSPRGKLVLHRQEDGDMIVAISPDPDEDRNSVEFCTIFSGGGRSSHTLKALYALMDAMAKDNAECPIGTSETIPFE